MCRSVFVYTQEKDIWEVSTVLAFANRVFLGTLFRFACEPTSPFVYVFRRESR